MDKAIPAKDIFRLAVHHSTLELRSLHGNRDGTVGVTAVLLDLRRQTISNDRRCYMTCAIDLSQAAESWTESAQAESSTEMGDETVRFIWA